MPLLNFAAHTCSVKNYEETLAYLFAQLPMYQRVGAAAYKEGLDGILALCEALGNPHKNLRTVHVAGTNGKGSTSHMLASILQEAGLKTGLYTSPHLVDFRERIKVNGVPVSKEFVVEFTGRNQALFEAQHPSFFEMTVAMCFEWFAQQGVDIAVIETGMGGRLDSTNIITPEISVITNIGLDHTAFLGDTPAKIAGEKAGIIKPGIPVVIGEATEATLPVFTQKAEESHAPLILADDISYCTQAEDEPSRFTVFPTHFEPFDLYSPLTGKYQEANLCTAFAAFQALRQRLPQLQDGHFIDGIRQTIQNTGLRGRWEILQQSPTLICDVGHNAHGFRLIMESIRRHPHERLFMVLGFVNDKDLSPVLSQLPAEAHYVFTKASNPRSLPAEAVATAAGTHNLHGQIVPDVKQAVKTALEQAQPGDLVFLGGSTFVVADYLTE